MDTTALRGAYDRLFEAAAIPDLGEAPDNGWDADHILAHLISVDAAVAAVALGVVSGSRPGFDNRITLERWNLARIIADHPNRSDLIDHLRKQAAVLCEVADQLSDQECAVLIPALLLSNDAVSLDQPIPLAALINGLAEDHIPRHTQQLIETKPSG